MLDRCRQVLEAGRSEGLHRGAQVAIRLGDEEIDLLVGEAAPGIPMTADHLFPWFSATKIITSIAVAQQVQEGLLAWDDRVSDHVPGFEVGGKDHVRIAHLLSHTAGFRGPADRLPAGSRPGPNEVVSLAIETPLESDWVPGERAAYQPRGCFAVLAHAVSRLVGRPFVELATENVVEQAGLVDTWLNLTPARADSYGERMGLIEDTSAGGMTPRPELAAVGVDSDGATGAIGPARDLARLVACLGADGTIDGERLLDETIVKDMVARHREGLTDETFGAVIDWGRGLMINSWSYRQRPAPYGYGDFASDAAFGHGGARSSVAFADPRHGLAVALIANGLPTEAVNHRRTQPAITALYEDLGLTP